MGKKPASSKTKGAAVDRARSGEEEFFYIK
jgi:hypothetical protein